MGFNIPSIPAWISAPHSAEKKMEEMPFFSDAVLHGAKRHG